VSAPGGIADVLVGAEVEAHPAARLRNIEAARPAPCVAARLVGPQHLCLLLVPPDLLGFFPELVVQLALLAVGEDVEGVVDPLEFLLRRLVSGVHVGVVLLGQLAVGLLDLVVRGALRNPQPLVVVVHHVRLSS
jgi:hypothetical protein